MIIGTSASDSSSTSNPIRACEFLLFRSQNIDILAKINVKCSNLIFGYLTACTNI